jgi:ABC-type sulfate transport system permease component
MISSPPPCNSTDTTPGNAALEFRSLQYSLFITCFVEVLGGLFFLMTAWYIVSDKNKCDRVIANSAGKPFFFFYF